MRHRRARRSAEQTKDSILKLDAYVQAGKKFVEDYRTNELPKLKTAADRPVAMSADAGPDLPGCGAALDVWKARLLSGAARQLGIRNAADPIVQSGDRR